MAAKDIAYGISALSTRLYSKAENDELLVRESDGKMFYKREPDGQIVGFSANDYTDKELMKYMIPFFNGNSVVLNPADVVLYHTYDISKKAYLNETDNMNLDLPITFAISQNEHGFFVRIRGTQEANAIVAYTEKASSIHNGGTVALGIEVNGNPTEVFLKFNELTFINIAGTGPSTVDIKYVSFPNFKTAYAALPFDRRTELIDLNLGNQRIYADVLDIVSFVTSISQADTVNDSGLTLKSAFSLAKVQEEMDESSGFVMSASEPDYACLWAKIV